jgi:alpha-glucosidase (family GH31 glycosyl hydrolase)
MRLFCKIFIVLAIGLFYNNIFAKEKFSWSSGQFIVDIVDSKFTIYEDKIKIVTISSINFNFTPPKSIFIAAQTKNKLTLTFTYPPEVLYRDQLLDLNTMVEITASDHTLHFQGSPKWATSCTIRMEDNGERYFGILEPLYPDNSKSPDLRGKVVDVEINGDANLYFENYASTWSAFYMTNKGYASFFDSFARGKYRLGINNETELFHRTDKLDWYLFTGKNGDEIMKAYYTVIGKPKFVPMWACGPIGWRDENKGGKDEILDDIKKMTDLRIPFTGWWVDRPYSHGAQEWSKMDFNERFANPQDWISTIRNTYGMEFMTWVGPLTFGDPDFPAFQYNPEGYFDLSHPEAVKEFGSRLKKYQYSVGVRGHKMDRADQRYPLHIPWYDKTPEAEQRNKYVYLFSTTIDSLLRDAWGENQFNFARAAFHRCQPYLSAVWGGDSRSSWDGMAANLANAIRCSFMGFPVWGSDVGGYLGGQIPENLYARWLQFGAWSGLYEIKIDDAGGKRADRVPWKYSKRLQTIFKDYTTQRMEMQPFYYSLANTSYKNGPIMKPLAYVFPDDKKSFSLWNEYMVGNAFLVAPILDSINYKSVYLPSGTWYDYYDFSKVFEGNKEIDAAYPLELIPVFVRANSIYITGTLLAGNSKLWNVDPTAKGLKIYVFPGKNNETAMFDYVDYLDSNKEKQLSIINKNRSIVFASQPIASDAILLLKLEDEPSKVIMNGTTGKYSWDAGQGFVRIELKKNMKYKISIN